MLQRQTPYQRQNDLAHISSSNLVLGLIDRTLLREYALEALCALGSIVCMAAIMLLWIAISDPAALREWVAGLRY